MKSQTVLCLSSTSSTIIAEESAYADTLDTAAAALLDRCESLIDRCDYAAAEREVRPLLIGLPHWRALAVAARCCLEISKEQSKEQSARLVRSIPLFDLALDSYITMSARTDAATEANLFNDRGVARYELSLLESNSGLMAKARDDFESALLRLPDHDRALCNLGLVHWRSGFELVALTTFDRAVAANGCNPHTLNNRGALRRELGDAERALPDFHNAIRLDPHYAVAQRNRDEVLEALGEPAPLQIVSEAFA